MFYDAIQFYIMSVRFAERQSASFRKYPTIYSSPIKIDDVLNRVRTANNSVLLIV